jgi:hypothetical protein
MAKTAILKWCEPGAALLLSGIVEQVFDQRGDDEDNDNPDGNLHAVPR